MSEAFHQWVANMPWWEKLYYEIFDPNTMRPSLSTNHKDVIKDSTEGKENV